MKNWTKAFEGDAGNICSWSCNPTPLKELEFLNPVPRTNWQTISFDQWLYTREKNHCHHVDPPGRNKPGKWRSSVLMDDAHIADDVHIAVIVRRGQWKHVHITHSDDPDWILNHHHRHRYLTWPKQWERETHPQKCIYDSLLMGIFFRNTSMDSNCEKNLFELGCRKWLCIVDTFLKLL